MTQRKSKPAPPRIVTARELETARGGAETVHLYLKANGTDAQAQSLYFPESM